MSRLKVRKIDFQFPDDIALQWCPENPYWGNCVNYTTVIAPAFEKYVIRGIREAMPQIKDPRVKEDAELFCFQEGQHSRHHMAHMDMLIRKYPGLRETVDLVNQSFDKQFKERDTAFHLSYGASIELMFAPIAKFVVNNRESLMKGSDPRIASFMLWHLIEEFEHRSAAYNVYQEIVGSHWYRLKTLPAVFKQIMEVYQITMDGFEKHIPKSDWDAVGPIASSGVLKGIPLRSTLGLLYELSCTLLPYHDAETVDQPEWVSQWFADEAAGRDMRHYFPH